MKILIPLVGEEKISSHEYFVDIKKTNNFPNPFFPSQFTIPLGNFHFILCCHSLSWVSSLESIKIVILWKWFMTIREKNNIIDTNVYHTINSVVLEALNAVAVVAGVVLRYKAHNLWQ